MKNCISCFYQGDNNVDNEGNDKVFCMLKCKWCKEKDSCDKYVEYAELSKDIRAQYALSQQKSSSGVSVKKQWALMLTTLIVSFILFLIVVKFFDKYIF